MEKERREALKRKQSEKLLGFFKQKSPKKKLKASSLVDMSSSPSKEIVKMLDEELFNKSKTLDVDVVQNWKRTLEKFKSARGNRRQTYDTGTLVCTCRVKISIPFVQKAALRRKMMATEWKLLVMMVATSMS